MSQGPTKVAIVGGGCAAITAAFELSRPEHGNRFDIVLYQVGWRLGGKGASGRGPWGRIEEHGLHIWMGFYENAFRLLRECYAELAAGAGAFDFGAWSDAFITEDTIGLSAESAGGAWHNWSAVFPPRDGMPGDPVSGEALFSAQRYMGGALAMLSALVESIDSRRRGAQAPDAPADLENAGVEAPVFGDPQQMAAAIRELTGGASAINAAVMAEALALLQGGLKMLPSALANPLTDLADWVAHNLRKWLEQTLASEPYYQHLWEMMDVVVAMVVGSFRHGLLTDPRGFDAIDDYDICEWLRLNGASERSLRSAFVRGSYDLAMAYEDGDPQRPRLSAAVALRCTFRMFFSYRGALYWRLRAGMGDIVFAPYYEALRRRGVKFEFFHRLTNVRLGEDADGAAHVAGLDFDVQAKVLGQGAYEPLVLVKGRPCWPSQPDFSQLEGGEAMAAEPRDFEDSWDTRRAETRTLEVTKDFDFVVLGVSVGEIPTVCREILARDVRWRSMVAHVKTIETQAFQIWLDQDLGGLGWTAPHFIGSAFAKPFDSWCDMAHSVPEEGWDKPPRTALYFCGALAGPAAPPDADQVGYPERRRDEVRGLALTHLQVTARRLWPGAYDGEGDFRWDLLRAPDAAEGVDRFDSQYWRANVNPSDRYVLALPGAARHRISPLDMTYDNLTLAGDWTACGLNEGCVEAAVISGRLAAHALAGAPTLGEIVGYDHP